MFSLLVSIIAIALSSAFLIITIMYIDKPFKGIANTQLAMNIGQQYIDFGAIISSADSLGFNISSIDDIRIFNKTTPKINGVDYVYAKTSQGERYLYNSNISQKDCVEYEKIANKNKEISINDVMKNKTVESYAEDNKKNYSCFIEQSTGNSYIVFIYSHYLG